MEKDIWSFVIRFLFVSYNTAPMGDTLSLVLEIFSDVCCLFWKECVWHELFENVNGVNVCVGQRRSVHCGSGQRNLLLFPSCLVSGRRERALNSAAEKLIRKHRTGLLSGLLVCHHVRHSLLALWCPDSCFTASRSSKTLEGILLFL